MPPKPVVLILGSGPRIGASLASHFHTLGYSLALCSRSAIPGKTAQGHLSLSFDLSNPSSLPTIFSAITSEFHVPPSIVIYNAAAFTPPEGDDLFSIPVESVGRDLGVNAVGVYAAAREAVRGWEGMKEREEKEGGGVKKVFIYTGNKLNTGIGPLLLTATLGMGKAAAGYFIGAADGRYRGEGYR